MRELNQHPGRVIGMVKNGEIVEITERGRPVARIVPPPSGSGVLDELVRSGRVHAPSAIGRRVPVPPVLGDPLVSASEEVAAALSSQSEAGP